MTLTQTEDAVRRRTAINDYLKRLLQHKNLRVRVVTTMKDLRKKDPAWELAEEESGV